MSNLGKQREGRSDKSEVKTEKTLERGADSVETIPDAWERFEKAVDAMVRPKRGKGATCEPEKDGSDQPRSKRVHMANDTERH